jgi:hypothetical protein
MADTKHHAPSSALPVEGDGVSYRGIVWFIVILTATTLFCQALVIGMFKLFEYRVAQADAGRPALAVPTGTLPPGPVLLTDERTNLKDFRAHEDTTLATYGWINKNMGTVHIPIDVAKAKVLEKGFPVRPAEAPAAKESGAKAEAPKAEHKGGL